MQKSGGNIHYLYQENEQFIQSIIHEPVNKKEILLNLDKKLEKFNAIDRDFVFVSAVVSTIWIFIALIALAPILEISFMVSTIFDERIFLEVYPPLYLLYSSIQLAVVFIAAYWFVRPLVRVSKDLVMYPIRHSSAENLYKYMLEVNCLVEGIISSVTLDGNKYLIQYSYMRKNDLISSSYLIRDDKKIEINDKVSIVSTNKFDFPL